MVKSTDIEEGVMNRGQWLYLLVLLLLTSVPIAMLVEGVNYMDSCPAEAWIPRYMAVMGMSQLFTLILLILHVCYKYGCDSKDNLCTFTAAVLLALWNLGWLIAGSVWIFSLHNLMSTNPSSPFFCDPAIVMFGLYVTSITWVVLGIAGIYVSIKFFC